MHGSLCPDAGGSATERVGVPEGPEVHHSWFPNGIECGGSARAIGGYARRAMTTVALGAYPRIGLRLLAMACVVGGVRAALCRRRQQLRTSAPPAVAPNAEGRMRSRPTR